MPWPNASSQGFLTLQPRSWSGADRAAMPHPTGRKLIGASLLRLVAVLGASCELLGCVILESGHDVRSMAHAIIASVKVWSVFGTLAARTAFCGLRLARTSRLPCAKAEGCVSACNQHQAQESSKLHCFFGKLLQMCRVVYAMVP